MLKLEDLLEINRKIHDAGIGHCLIDCFLMECFKTNTTGIFTCKKCPDDDVNACRECIKNYFRENFVVSHWIKFGNTGSEYSDRWQCDNCKKTVRTETWGKKCEYPLCPYCGADMKEEMESEIESLNKRDGESK